MVIIRKQKARLFVDRSTHRWVVQDQEGLFWMIPAIDEAWEKKQPFACTDETELEPVPDHYKYMLGLSE